MGPHISSGEHQFPHNDADMEKGLWPLGTSICTYFLPSHQYTGTWGFPQFIYDGAGTPPDYCQISYNTDCSQGYLSPSDPYHPCDPPAILVDTSPVEPYDDKSNGSSPEQHHQNNIYFLPMQVPLVPYDCGNKQKDWNMEQPVLFSEGGCPGVKLVSALEGRFTRMDDRDGLPFDEERSGITIRLHFPGYPSSTKVENKLKKSAKLVASDKKSKARSMQVSTKNYKSERGPVTRSKILQEVCKRIDWHIKDLLQYANFDEGVGEEWRLWEGAKERMTILRLEKVSKGSWSPIIVIDRPCLPPSVPSTSA